MKSERPPTGSVQPLVAAAPGHAAKSSVGPAARPLPPRPDAGSAASEREPGDWEHLAAAVERKLRIARSVAEARRRYENALDGDQWSLSASIDREIAVLTYELMRIFEEQCEQPRGGNAELTRAPRSGASRRATGCPPGRELNADANAQD